MDFQEKRVELVEVPKSDEWSIILKSVKMRVVQRLQMHNPDLDYVVYGSSESLSTVLEIARRESIPVGK